MVAIDRERVKEVTQKCYVDLYISGTLPTGWWPWRMQPAHDSGPNHVERCETYILDSSLNKPDVGNKEVFDRAHQLGADMVVLADEPEDMHATITSVREGLELLDDHPCEAEPIVPLQPPHDECYQRLQGLADRYAIGGVKDAPPSTKIEAARSVRELAGQDIWLHGLGFTPETEQEHYGPRTLVHALNEDPDLLDSLDYSTAIQKSVSLPLTNGDYYSIPMCAYVGFIALEGARLLSPVTEITTDESRTPLSW